MHICIFLIQYSLGLVQTANKVYWRHFVIFRVFFVSLLCSRVGDGGTSTSLKV